MKQLQFDVVCETKGCQNYEKVINTFEVPYSDRPTDFSDKEDAIEATFSSYGHPFEREDICSGCTIGGVLQDGYREIEG